MHDTASPDMRSLEADAYEQGGYFTSDQAREHGVSRQLLDHHVRQGRFERVRRGLYRVRGFPTSQHDDIREKWMAVGIDNVPDKVHLLVPRRHRGLRRPSGVVIHTHPDDEEILTVWRNGMRLTAPARTLVDVADELQPERAAMAAEHALRLGLLTRRQLEQEATRQRKTRVVNAAPESMRYATAAAFRQALEDRLKTEAAMPGSASRASASELRSSSFSAAW